VFLFASAVGGTEGIVLAVIYDILVGLLVASQLIIMAGAALFSGDVQLCSNLLSAAVAILVTALTLTSVIGKFLNPLLTMLFFGGAVGYMVNDRISRVCR
jgi:hypothetical protein